MSFKLGDSVWERSDNLLPDTMSDRQYILAVTMFTVYGLFLTSIIGYNTMAWHPTSIWTVLGIGLVIPIIGIIIALKSDFWPVSLAGYTMVVVGLGIIIGPCVAMYKTTVVINAIMATFGVTCIMSLTGIIYPKSLAHWGGYLSGALLALIVVRCIQIYMFSRGMMYEGHGWMIYIEYAGAVLFSLYIIYDWNRAMRLTHTLDNAVDCALAIYLDIINLFLHLLKILGSRSSSD